MIRATRSRSTERQRDRESRPNHMLSPRDSRKPPRLAKLRRDPGDFHSVAKQASFGVASRRDLKGFWKDFGKFGKAKRRPKSIFARCFCNVFFEGVLALILDGFLEARTPKNQ